MESKRYQRIAAIAFAACFVGMASYPPGARAADSKGEFALHGVGALTCNDVTGALLKGDASVRSVLASWLMGYVSAMNRFQRDTYDATPVQSPEALVNMVVGLCQKNDSARIETAAQSLFKILEKAKLTTASPEIQTAAGGRATTLRKDTLIAVQKRLRSLKLLRDDADGSFGPATAAAIREYQKREKMPETSLPDPATIVKLLVANPPKRR